MLVHVESKNPGIDCSQKVGIEPSDKKTKGHVFGRQVRQLQEPTIGYTSPADQTDKTMASRKDSREPLTTT
jgi:hypothetical protein